MAEAIAYKDGHPYGHPPCETCETDGFNRLGICNTCGRVGSYNFGSSFRCVDCMVGREPELLAAARDVLATRDSDDRVSASLRRLESAVSDYEGTGLLTRGLAILERG